jgi:hypothetical protein
MSETNPEFEPDDAQDHLELYAKADPKTPSTTSRNSAKPMWNSCAASPKADGDRTAVHLKVGPITLSQMLHEWALHDLGHIRQVAELVARASTWPAPDRSRLSTTSSHDDPHDSLAFAAAASIGAQTFIQMSDPQFGMFAKDVEFAHENANFEFAVAAANRLKPAFVVITGDLTNKAGDPAQVAEFHRIAKKLDPRSASSPSPAITTSAMSHRGVARRIPQKLRSRLLRVPSRRDRRHRSEFQLERGSKNVPEEAAKMEAWFKTELAKARNRSEAHHRLPAHFLFPERKPGEPDQYFNIPPTCDSAT